MGDTFQERRHFVDSVVFLHRKPQLRFWAGRSCRGTAGCRCYPATSPLLGRGREWSKTKIIQRNPDSHYTLLNAARDTQRRARLMCSSQDSLHNHKTEQHRWQLAAHWFLDRNSLGSGFNRYLLKLYFNRRIGVQYLPKTLTSLNGHLRKVISKPSLLQTTSKSRVWLDLPDHLPGEPAWCVRELPPSTLARLSEPSESSLVVSRRFWANESKETEATPSTSGKSSSESEKSPSSK